MVTTNILQQSSNRLISERKGHFSVVEYQKDISTNPTTAQTSYYMAEMGYRCKQLVIELSNNGVVIQAGAMQWLAGNIQTRTNIKGVGDFAKGNTAQKTRANTVRL